MGYNCFDEVLGNRSFDSPSPAAPDASLPWEHDPAFTLRPSDHSADRLIKRSEHSALLESVFGPDRAQEMLTVKPNATATALAKRIDAISTATIGGLLDKSVRVASGAPLRKARIGEIVKRFRRDLTARGFDADYDLGPLQASCETLVTALIMAA